MMTKSNTEEILRSELRRIPWEVPAHLTSFLVGKGSDLLSRYSGRVGVSKTLIVTFLQTIKYIRNFPL